jgi:hypothetical protein
LIIFSLEIEVPKTYRKSRDVERVLEVQLNFNKIGFKGGNLPALNRGVEGLDSTFELDVERVCGIDVSRLFDFSKLDWKEEGHESAAINRLHYRHAIQRRTEWA